MMSLPLKCARHPEVMVSHITELRKIPECGVEAGWWGIWSEEQPDWPRFVFITECPLEAADEFAARAGGRGGARFKELHRIRAICAVHVRHPADGCPECVQEEAEFEAMQDAEQLLADERADWLEDVAMEPPGFHD